MTNNVLGLILLVVGAAVLAFSGDGTVLILCVWVAIGLFLSKEKNAKHAKNNEIEVKKAEKS